MSFVEHDGVFMDLNDDAKFLEAFSDLEMIERSYESNVFDAENVVVDESQGIQDNIDSVLADEDQGGNQESVACSDVDDDPMSMPDDNEPILVKLFHSHGEAFDFYNLYGHHKGFGVRKHYTNKKNGEVCRARFVCSKEGLKDLNDKRRGNARFRHRETRTDCKAKFQVSLRLDGMWKVDLLDDIHNHSLILTPSKKDKFRSRKRFHASVACRELVSTLSNEGLRPTHISKVINVGFSVDGEDLTPRNVSEILRTQHRNNIGKECLGIIRHFQDKGCSDDAFYFAMDLTHDGCFKSVFWADGRSRDAYLKFGDAIVFYVTYRTNKFNLPFAPFVGVNHHRQTILLGAALLEDETFETFCWVFEHFLKCMFNKQPTSIITDQDGAICKAIAKVLPSSRHRFCAWHIQKHVQEHLMPIRCKHVDFEEAHKVWVKSHTKEEFESRWIGIVEKYQIEEKSWLSRMYKLKHFWAKAYLKDTFFAGMTTSGRSESIHAFFDSYINANTMLNDFVRQYDKALMARRATEEDADFVTMNSRPTSLTGSLIEDTASKYYTKNMFDIFMKEWKLANVGCSHEKIGKVGNVTRYRVGLYQVDTSFWRTVDYDPLGGPSCTCSCGKFETYGILCKHALYVLKLKVVKDLPKRYIMKRWTIDARYKTGEHDSDQITTNRDENHEAVKLWVLRRRIISLMENASDSPSSIAKIVSFVDSLEKEEVARKRSIMSNNTEGELESQANLLWDCRN